MTFITPAQLREWLAALMVERTVIGPAAAGEGLVLYQPVTSPDEIVFDFSRAALSPKAFFLPATEVILTVERVRAGAAEDGATPPPWTVAVSAPEPERDQVLFGVRPCDAHGLEVLDALLLQEPVDPYYAQRRRRTSLIGLACPAMGPACFCTSMGSSPDDASAMDVMLYAVEGGYALEVLTSKGQDLTAGLTPAPYGDERPRRAWPPAEYTVPPRAVWARLYNDPSWGKLADRCLSCKICAFVCPTCRCFDVRDYTTAQEPGRQQIERLRCWDSCLAEGYRRIAGGHNPRPTTAHRLRNRFYCKFHYYPADFGPLGCVGCGRCVEHCPQNVDITEVLQIVAAKGEEVVATVPGA